ncbi:uncharacterized protein N7459_003823 [Penicillium hispanicum]|uniref:uncharacterized protein n=1 Tax=Penicillium hispanicum TaxID=1080232 RepID=UPI00253FF354|nr:uncharacterized protein N7459_003823 [Penicillium hispanicum]KAJ5584023.1 hypothetical protein N7459_003823 [Penicillium hispanicum]
MPYYTLSRDSAQAPLDQDIHLGTIPCVLCHIAPRPGNIIQGAAIPARTIIKRCVEANCIACQDEIKPQYLKHCWCHHKCVETLASVGIQLDQKVMQIVWNSTISIASSYRHFESDEQRALVAAEGIRAIPRIDETHRNKTLPKNVLRSLPKGLRRYLSSTNFLFSRLPFEIVQMITRFSGLHPRLTVIGETRRLIEHATSHMNSEISGQSSEISLDKPIYIASTLFRGVSYICMVNNTPFNNTNVFTELPELIQLPKKPRWILIAFDHVGVREIQFLEAKKSHPAISRDYPWYRWLYIPSTKSIALHYNGLFLLSIGPRKPSELNWNVPFPPTTRKWNICGKGADWNTMVDLTLPGLKGLLVAFRDRHIIGIHAFTGVDARYHKFALQMCTLGLQKPPIGTPKARLQWFYFPLQKGEQIVKAWVQSSLGRFYAFGGYQDTRLRTRPLTADGDGAITSLIYGMKDANEGGICRIGAVCASWASSERPLISQMDKTYNRDNVPGLEPSISIWPFQHLTWAPLEDLQQVQLTKLHPKLGLHGPIGAILSYKNGRTETLGEIDWDLGLCDPVLAPIEALEQAFQCSKYDTIRTIVEAGEETDGWVPWPTHGMVIWVAWDHYPPHVFCQ